MLVILRFVLHLRQCLRQVGGPEHAECVLRITFRESPGEHGQTESCGVHENLTVDHPGRLEVVDYHPVVCVIYVIHVCV